MTVSNDISTLPRALGVSAGEGQLEPQRFVFDDADWRFYEMIAQRLSGKRVFLTYLRGRLEVVTTSLLHETVSRLIYRMICVLAEETGTPLRSAGAATLESESVDAGIQPDESFYLNQHVERMRGKQDVDLETDPPPDLAVEVEVTKRLGARKTIYQTLGVPEVWRYSTGGLSILLKQPQDYVVADRSPTFPQLSPQELYGFIAAGLVQDETVWARSFRKRVQEAVQQGANP